jgi:hypothetical protein
LRTPNNHSSLVNAPDSYFGCPETEIIPSTDSVQADNKQNRSRILFILQWLKHATDRLTAYNSEVENAEISSTTLPPYDSSFLGWFAVDRPAIQKDSSWTA